MGLIGNTEYIKTKNGDYVEVHKGLFHTHIVMPDGTEIELDTDFDDLVKLLLNKNIPSSNLQLLFVYSSIVFFQNKYAFSLL